MEKSVKFIMLVGIQGSGKSSWAKYWKNNNKEFEIVSSDEVRKELFGTYRDEDTSKVMEECLKRVREKLKNRINIIYDTTNLNSKRRMKYLKAISDIKNVTKEVIFFPTDLYSCLYRNYNRESHIVPIQRIYKAYLNCQVPMYHEGWDNITYYGTINPLNRNVEPYDETYGLSYEDYITNILREIDKDVIELPQDNPHHTLSASRHMYVTYKNLIDELNNYDNISRALILATLLHDVGKAYCKNFKEGSIYANYYGHENISSYLAVNYMMRRGYSDRDITYVSSLIQLHSRFFNLETKEQYINFLKLIGSDMYNELHILNKFDKLAK